MVSEVHAAKFFYIAETPYDVTIIAWGKAATPNWSNPRLEPHHYFVPPEDGIQGFSFIADPPEGIQSAVRTPIIAIHGIQRDVRHYWGENLPLKAVRIGSVVAMPELVSLQSGGVPV